MYEGRANAELALSIIYGGAKRKMPRPVWVVSPAAGIEALDRWRCSHRTFRGEVALVLAPMQSQRGGSAHARVRDARAARAESRDERARIELLRRGRVGEHGARIAYTRKRQRPLNDRPRRGRAGLVGKAGARRARRRAVQRLRFRCSGIVHATALIRVTRRTGSGRSSRSP